MTYSVTIQGCFSSSMRPHNKSLLYKYGLDHSNYNEPGELKGSTGVFKVRSQAYSGWTEPYKVRTGVFNEVAVYRGIQSEDPGVFKVRTGVLKVRTGVFKVRTWVFKVRTGVLKVRTGVLKVRTGVFKVRTMQSRIRTCKEFPRVCQAPRGTQNFLIPL